jgi:hypothetical protein
LFDALQIDSVKENERIFFRRKLKNKITLRNDASTGFMEYDLIKEIEQTDFCKQLYFFIYCKGVERWAGVFSVTDCEFDQDRCNVTFLPDVYDIYSCILDRADVKKNILSVSPIISTTADLSNTTSLEFKIHITTPQDFWIMDGHETPGDPDPTGTWWSFQIQFDPPVRYQIFAREVLILPCVGGACQSIVGWIEEEDNCSTSENCKFVRDASTAYAIDLDSVTHSCTGGTPDPPISTPPFAPWQLAYAGCGQTIIFNIWVSAKSTVLRTYTRNRLMFDVLEFLIEDCELSYKTEFFTDSVNYVTGLANKLKHLTFSQKSDIKNFLSTEQAWKGDMSFNDFMLCLGIFNLKWFINSDGEIQIEHVSWFNRILGLDLTESKYENFIRSKSKYKYNKIAMPKYEEFAFMEAGNVDFIGVPIEYESACVNEKEGENKKDFQVNILTTDLLQIFNSPQDISNDGFVMLQNEYDGSYTVGVEAGILTGNNIVNGHLSWANLHENYWKYDRVLLEGNMNDTLTTFLSKQRQKQQVELEIPYCCEEEFDPLTEFVRTPLGDGEVVTMTEDLKNDTLKLTLVYD